MRGQRRRIAEIEEEMLEATFLNPSELTLSTLTTVTPNEISNKNDQFDQMVKTMSGALTSKRARSRQKGASSSVSSKKSRSVVSSVCTNRRHGSPVTSPYSYTSYDPSTSPTLQASSMVKGVGKGVGKRNCSPLPDWLFSTFASLPQNHPLHRLSLAKSAPFQTRIEPVPVTPANPEPPIYKEKPPRRHRSTKTRKERPPEPDRIFAFDPFDAQEEPEVDNPAAEDNRNAAGVIGALDASHYDGDSLHTSAEPESMQSEEPWARPVEIYPEERHLFHNNTMAVVQDSLCPPVQTTPYSSHQPFETSMVPLDGWSPYCGRRSEVDLSPQSNHFPEPLSDLHDELTTDPEIPEPKYLSHMYRTPGPAKSLAAKPPLAPQRQSAYPEYLNSQELISVISTASPFVPGYSPQYPTYLQSPLLQEPTSSGSSLSAPSIAQSFPSPQQPSISRLDPDLRAPPALLHAPVPPNVSPLLRFFDPQPLKPTSPDFHWKRFDRNNISARPPASLPKRPIYQIPDVDVMLDDDGDYSELSSILPSLLLGRQKGTESTLGTHGKTAFIPQFDSAKKVSKTMGQRELRTPEQQRGRQSEPHTPPQPKSSVSSPKQERRRDLDSEGSRARSSSSPFCQIQIAGKKDSSPECRTSTSKNPIPVRPAPKSSFAPAPGIYISPLRGSETSSEEIKRVQFSEERSSEKDGGRPDSRASQGSDDSIKSWSERSMYY
ncbi:hypothetical protein DFP72DRAFT_1165653 [Ephemerocybe angulata]|uniref:Uncharacterized protein n=1 Tax=Ephemerocybe angulata TaxID=980116 RepID=A0A8H6IBD0_9AGAR|nr:hypothetical protein DFP72DRAFT_1165653 [Tulosesus angulatus]